MNNEVGTNGKGWMGNKFITQEKEVGEKLGNKKRQGKVKLMMKT